MPPTTRCMETRRAASSMAITIATATCRFTSSATGTFWRPNNIDASAGEVEEVARIVGHLRACWPRVRILLRADAGFAREQLMHWCEHNSVDFLFGLAKNARLTWGTDLPARSYRDRRGPPQ